MPNTKFKRADIYISSYAFQYITDIIIRNKCLYKAEAGKITKQYITYLTFVRKYSDIIFYFLKISKKYGKKSNIYRNSVKPLCISKDLTDISVVRS